MSVAVEARARPWTGPASTMQRAAWRYLPVAIFLLVWQLVVELVLVDRAFLPSVGATVTALWEMTRNGELALNLLVSIYRALGDNPGLLGTLGHGIFGALVPGKNTTPDAITIQALLREFIERGSMTAVMEVSSHGIAQGRVRGIHFDAAVFTNLTQDHLDYHATFDEYRETKARLFDELSPLAVAVLNAGSAVEMPWLGDVDAVLHAWHSGEQFGPALAGLLWGDRDEDHARNSLRQTLFLLRRMTDSAQPQLLNITNHTVALNPSSVDVDVRAFEDLARNSTPVALQQAAELYRGDLLDGFTVDEAPFEEWLLQERERPFPGSARRKFQMRQYGFFELLADGVQRV